MDRSFLIVLALGVGVVVALAVLTHLPENTAAQADPTATVILLPTVTGTQPTQYPLPWENGYIESFKGKLRDELLNGEIFFTLAEARVLVERWRREHNHVRPHSALGYRPPAPEAVVAPPVGVAA